MPRWFWPAVIILVALSWIPLAVVAKNRAAKSASPRYQFIPDMDQRHGFGPQQANPLFADGRAMRPSVPGTVARGSLGNGEAFDSGRVDDAWIEEIPVPVTGALLDRGRERYDVFCAPCHGLDGEGRGIVSVRADALQEGTWIPPVSYHTDQIRGRPAGHLFNTITNGIRSMPAYATQIDPSDRWAIVAYVRALQRSRYATIDDVPVEMRGKLR